MSTHCPVARHSQCCCTCGLVSWCIGTSLIWSWPRNAGIHTHDRSTTRTKLWPLIFDLWPPVATSVTFSNYVFMSVTDTQSQCTDTGVYFLAACNPHSYFLCGNGQCIDPSSVCDVTEDCSDGSDEWNCTYSEFSIKQTCIVLWEISWSETFVDWNEFANNLPNESKSWQLEYENKSSNWGLSYVLLSH